MALGALWTINAVYLAVTLAAFLFADVGFDWAVYSEAGRRFFDGGLYDWEGHASFRYSPILAAAFGLISPIGYVGWTGLHFGALLLVPRRIAALALLLAPFWIDVYNGSTMTFVAVAALIGVSGGIWGARAFFLLSVLMPRPLMLPVMLWLMLKRREHIVSFVAISGVHALAVWLTGWGEEWIGILLARGTDDLGARMDIGPSVFLGLWWYPVGLVLAGWLTVRGRVGAASVFASPYWLPHYLLMLLVDMRAKPAGDGGLHLSRKRADRSHTGSR